MSQPAPIPNEYPVIGNLVARDLFARMKKGVETYGVPLQPFNGRDALQDLYEELLDACCYIRQAMYERDIVRRESAEILNDALSLNRTGGGWGEK